MTFRRNRSAQQSATFATAVSFAQARERWRRQDRLNAFGSAATITAPAGRRPEGHRQYMAIRPRPPVAYMGDNYYLQEDEEVGGAPLEPQTYPPASLGPFAEEANSTPDWMSMRIPSPEEPMRRESWLLSLFGDSAADADSQALTATAPPLVQAAPADPPAVHLVSPPNGGVIALYHANDAGVKQDFPFNIRKILNNDGLSSSAAYLGRVDRRAEQSCIAASVVQDLELPRIPLPPSQQRPLMTPLGLVFPTSWTRVMVSSKQHGIPDMIANMVIVEGPNSVPGRYVFLGDTPFRKLEVGGYRIQCINVSDEPLQHRREPDVAVEDSALYPPIHPLCVNCSVPIILPTDLSSVSTTGQAAQPVFTDSGGEVAPTATSTYSAVAPSGWASAQQEQCFERRVLHTQGPNASASRSIYLDVPGPLRRHRDGCEPG